MESTQELDNETSLLLDQNMDQNLEKKPFEGL
jgi:hypothetical protein